MAQPDNEVLEKATLALEVDEVDEVDTALEAFNNLGKNGGEVGQANFQLPGLKAKLNEGAKELHNGTHYFRITGLDPSRYTNEENLILFLGTASYIADKRGIQNKKGDVVVHVTDNKAWAVPPEKRHGIHSNKSLPFHNDMGSDILALYAKDCAVEGGYTYLSPVARIYEDLVENHPKELSLLMSADWPIQISGRKPNYILSPLLVVHDDHVMMSLDPGRIGPQSTTAPHGSDLSVPSLTPAQRSAVALVLRLAAVHRIAVPLAPGDILFVNNWAMLHARDAYKDGSSGGRKQDGDGGRSRHLIRAWLRSTALGWSVPDAFKAPWDAAFGPAVAAVTPRYAAVPEKEYTVPKYTAGSAAFVIEETDGE